MRRNRIFKAIALLGAVCFAAGCSGSGAEESTSAPSVQTTASVTETTAGKNGADEQAANPLPEGWTFEKIAALVKIDGKPLKFPCTPEEFKSLIPKITFGEVDEYLNICDIYYNGENAGGFALNPDSGYSDYIMLYTDSIDDNGEVSIIDCPINQVDIIIPFLDDTFYNNIIPELSSEQHKVFRFKENNSIFVFSYARNNERIEMVHFEITDVEGD